MKCVIKHNIPVYSSNGLIMFAQQVYYKGYKEVTNDIKEAFVVDIAYRDIVDKYSDNIISVFDKLKLDREYWSLFIPNELNSIKIQYTHVFDEYAIRISHQSNKIKRGYFSYDCYNNMRIISNDKPNFKNDTLYIQGSDLQNDKRIILLSEQDFYRVLDLLDEFNSNFIDK